jgi:hypothetical protein
LNTSVKEAFMHKNEERIIRYVMEAVEQGTSIQEIKDSLLT